MPLLRSQTLTGGLSKSTDKRSKTVSRVSKRITRLLLLSSKVSGAKFCTAYKTSRGPRNGTLLTVRSRRYLKTKYPATAPWGEIAAYIEGVNRTDNDILQAWVDAASTINDVYDAKGLDGSEFDGIMNEYEIVSQAVERCIKGNEDDPKEIKNILIGIRALEGVYPSTRMFNDTTWEGIAAYIENQYK